MSLYETLQHITSEQDVKDAYIKAIGLKGYYKNLIDIQTKEVWFEAKIGKHSLYVMFTQLMHYVYQALNKGDEIPPFLVVMDCEKAAIMKTADVIPFLEKRTVKWRKRASDITQEIVDAVSPHIGTHFVQFKIETDEVEFISTVRNAIKKGDIIRTQITPDNLKQVFDKWVNMIGREIRGVDEKDYALLFYADIMSDGTVATLKNLPAELLHKNNEPIFSLDGKLYELGNKVLYQQFWAIYHRPPKESYRNYLLERKDSLIPIDERVFKGAFYTPLDVVDKAYDKLTEVLGKNWQREYIVWDMCCGVGNLEVKHSNPRNVYMSTIEPEDIKVMHATRTCVAATRFQYDYLNDDITDDGTIDYSLTDKVPQGLRDAIAKGKKILVLMNPPYKEATSANTTSGGKNKEGVAKTKFAATAMAEYGKARNELYTQFVVRIAQEIPTATLAMFSTLKYVVAPTLNDFRSKWKAKYLGGFVVDSNAFDGLNGDFPIGFLIWKTDMKRGKEYVTKIRAEVLDKKAHPIGEKTFYSVSNQLLLTDWAERPLANKTDAIPLKNAITPATASKDLRGTKWADGAIAWLNCAGNDLQNAATKTMLFSSGYGSGRGFFVTEKNLWQAAIIFSVRRLSISKLQKTWLYDRDQFLQPHTPPSEEFKTDCLIWMLFNGSNLTASANDLEWNGKKWSIVNHFIPYSEKEVNAPDRFESDFMVRYLKNKKLSIEAKAVLEEGRRLWQAYFEHTDFRAVRDELKLNRPDVGWYQIRNALEARNKSGNFPPVNFKPFSKAYESLKEKLRPQVYEFGFLVNS